LRSINRWSLQTPDANALCLGSQKLSYRELVNTIVQFSQALEGIGVRRGMLIGLAAGQLDKISEFILVLSIQVIGAVRVSDFSDEEVKAACDRIIVISPEEIGADRAKYFLLTKEWVRTAKSVSISIEDCERLNAYSPLPGQPLLFGNTSGTTGKKKYFFESQSAISAQIDLIGARYFMGNTKNLISLYGVNLSAAYIAACACFHRGGTVIFSTLHDFMEIVRANPNSHTLMILREANLFSNSVSEKLMNKDKLSSIRVLGAHLPHRARECLHTHLAKQVINSYSSNEAGQIAEILPNGEGKIYPDVALKIVDIDGTNLAIGQMGRVATKSSQQISGYLWNPELNATHFKDGWFISNDVGYLNAQGMLVYVDRADHMINLGGIKIPPKPFEEKIRRLPLVSDCVLIGENAFFEIETLLVGVEVTKACDHQILDKSIGDILVGSFAAYRIFYLEEFLRTDTGKVKRNELHSTFLKVSAQ
jgi:long-chain acyl-CoA synthetase